MKELSEESKKVKKLLDDFGLQPEIVEFDQSTKTSQMAADALGCDVGQIAKSMVFRNKADDSSILVIASGANRVERGKLEEIIGKPVKLADPDFVLDKTGYAVGGVAPVGHVVQPKAYMDKDLLEYDYVWAAAGTSNSVFKINTQKLKEITHAEVVVVA